MNNVYNKYLENLGKIGKGYCNRFLKTNRYRLRSKRCWKFGSNTMSNSSSYLNFLDMYAHNAEVLLESAKIAMRDYLNQWHVGVVLMDLGYNEID